MKPNPAMPTNNSVAGDEVGEKCEFNLYYINKQKGTR